MTSGSGLDTLLSSSANGQYTSQSGKVEEWDAGGTYIAHIFFFEVSFFFGREYTSFQEKAQLDWDGVRVMSDLLVIATDDQVSACIITL